MPRLQAQVVVNEVFDISQLLDPAGQVKDVSALSAREVKMLLDPELNRHEPWQLLPGQKPVSAKNVCLRAFELEDTAELPRADLEVSLSLKGVPIRSVLDSQGRFTVTAGVSSEELKARLEDADWAIDTTDIIRWFLEAEQAEVEHGIVFD
jgi:hypothetical protein